MPSSLSLQANHNKYSSPTSPLPPLSICQMLLLRMLLPSDPGRSNAPHLTGSSFPPSNAWQSPREGLFSIPPLPRKSGVLLTAIPATFTLEVSPVIGDFNTPVTHSAPHSLGSLIPLFTPQVA